MAWISYLRWVVLSNVLLCSVVPVRILAATHRPVHAVGRVALPGTGRKVSDRNPSPLATRRPLGILEGIQAHREREQAQGTLGTADHDTRALKAGQSRVPHSHGQAAADVHDGGLTGWNDGPTGSVPGADRTP